MNRMLLIVDPQLDFISGSLPVAGAAAAMDRLAEYIRQTDGEYLFKAVTVDWHPWNHRSFREQGGTWPVHCVQHTVGTALWPPLADALHATAGTTAVLRKGDDAAREEYSIFRNGAAAARLDTAIRELAIARIDLCGLAGDICVRDTLCDGVARYGAPMFRVLREFSPSLDGGATLDETIHSLQL